MANEETATTDFRGEEMIVCGCGRKSYPQHSCPNCKKGAEFSRSFSSFCSRLTSNGLINLAWGAHLLRIDRFVITHVTHYFTKCKIAFDSAAFRSCQNEDGQLVPGHEATSKTLNNQPLNFREVVRAYRNQDALAVTHLFLLNQGEPFPQEQDLTGPSLIVFYNNVALEAYLRAVNVDLWPTIITAIHIEKPWISDYLVKHLRRLHILDQI